MLEINNLIYSYDGAINVLDQASFKLEKGKIYCLLGVNGAGKTTLFNCLTGFLKSNLKLSSKYKINRLCKKGALAQRTKQLIVQGYL